MHARRHLYWAVVEGPSVDQLTGCCASTSWPGQLGARPGDRPIAGRGTESHVSIA